MLNQKVILITGGTGSFGERFTEMCLEKYNPKKIIIYSRDELKQFEMQDKFRSTKGFNKLRFLIGDVRDISRLKLAIRDVDIVVHAAALKQVPAAEYNPNEAIKTNVNGAQNIIDACLERGSTVKRVIALSTDKAAAPINLYGATKLVSDKLFLSANNIRGKKDIRFSVVRYGNVMNSRGSVIPVFLKNKSMKYFNVTDKEMTRFSITLEEGVNFVFKSIKNMIGGEIFIPKIPSLRIIDIAKAINSKAKIRIIGIRPGEKIHEEMITETDSLNTYEFKDYYIILNEFNFTTVNSKEISKIINSKGGKRCKRGFSYNSRNNKKFLSIKDIKKYINKLN